MKEKLIDIVSSIDVCAKARRDTGIVSVARIHCNYDGAEQTFWFTKDLYSARELTPFSQFGIFVPKNSRVAINMQSMDVGSSFEYEQLNYIKRLEHHRVELENRSDFQNQTIAIAGDTLLYQYRNIGEFLDALRENKEDIRDIENQISDLTKQIEQLKKQKNTGHQRGQITKSINELQKEYRILTQQQEDLKNITIYIRKQGEMRYSLIVDPVQTRIKSQNLFDGKTVVIDGGPGTGKSTTMIHRLAYLTDINAIDEDEKKNLNYYKLNSSQRKQLLNAIKNHRDWMFFSPSQLLKEYLAEAMKKEGLTNTAQKVWNWKDYCRVVLQSYYGLLEAKDTKAPFRECNLTGTLFIQGYDIMGELTNYYVGQLREIKDQLPKLNLEGTNFEWKSIAKHIRDEFEGVHDYDLRRFISLFISLESLYASDCKTLIRKNNTELSELTDKVCRLLDKQKDVKAEIKDLLDLTSESDEVAEEEIIEEEPVENETPEQAEKPSNKFVEWFKSLTTAKPKDEMQQPKDQLAIELQKWLKAYCHSRVDNDFQLSDEQQLIGEILIPLIGNEFDEPIQKIGNLILFEQYAQYTRGVKAIMLNGIPAKYKKFRNYLLKSKYEGCNLKLLRDVIQRKQNRELHHQEQSLLLGFINNLVKQIKATTSANIKHAYIDAFEEVSRPIIGIDEATDFSACDIYAMQSLLTREFNSLTLCGDMMQRLTTYGITSWEELNGIVANPMVVEMKTSYRQSKKLLEVARQLYVDTLEKTPSYKAFMKSSRVPEPLIFINENETAKIEWISKRIAEVYRAYGEQLPSIAIFVNDKGYIPRFIENLEGTEFFIKNKIKVLDGTKGNVNSNENHICIYPIEVVKGMEFDVVFFHNLDNSTVDVDLLKRYIYVGVSRAAFFLGITLHEPNQEISKYFLQNKDWFKI